MLSLGGADLCPDLGAAEAAQRGVALMAGDQHEPVALLHRTHDRGGDLPQQLDRAGQRRDVLVGELADVAVGLDQVEVDQLYDPVFAGGGFGVGRFGDGLPGDGSLRRAGGPRRSAGTTGGRACSHQFRFHSHNRSRLPTIASIYVACTFLERLMNNVFKSYGIEGPLGLK